MDRTCIPTNAPQTNDEPTSCNGTYYDWSCVLTDDNNIYLNTTQGTPIKELITKLVDKVSELDQILQNNNIT